MLESILFGLLKMLMDYFIGKIKGEIVSAMREKDLKATDEMVTKAAVIKLRDRLNLDPVGKTSAEVDKAAEDEFEDFFNRVNR